MIIGAPRTAASFGVAQVFGEDSSEGHTSPGGRTASPHLMPSVGQTLSLDVTLLGFCQNREPKQGGAKTGSLNELIQGPEGLKTKSFGHFSHIPTFMM